MSAEALRGDQVPGQRRAEHVLDRELRVAVLHRAADHLVAPLSVSRSFGSKFSESQLATWKWLEGEVKAPSVPLKSPLTSKGSQLVGLSVKFGLSRLSRTERKRKGMPSMICGSGSESAVTWALSGSTSTATRLTMLPRS